MLKNLTIRNYRVFKEFEISSLANVNLIVGTNNSGKSSLLEAIHLLMGEDVRSSLLHLMKEENMHQERLTLALTDLFVEDTKSRIFSTNTCRELVRLLRFHLTGILVLKWHCLVRGMIKFSQNYLLKMKIMQC
ncbi:MAG: AAA family ATPase [Chloroflexi bacterium]|nr:AAA family ATPase [Chloroflexota bacterium]